MKTLFSIKNILRIITIISWGVAVVWYFDNRTYEPLLALLAGTSTLIISIISKGDDGGIDAKNIKAGRNITISDQSQNGISVEDAEAGKDLKIIKK